MNVSLVWRRRGACLMTGAALATAMLSHTNMATAAPRTAPHNEDDRGRTAAVFVETNAVAGNAIAIYWRNADGKLSPGDVVLTGGAGTGVGLGSQGAVVASSDGHWLFAVNAGSNEVSAFAMKGHSVHLVGKVSSGGLQPISLTARDDMLYVLNTGGAGNITGFNINDEGLSPIAGSTQPLSNNGVGSAPGPAQVQFNHTGDALVVTEKASNQILVYPVNDGVAAAGHVFASSGQTPFGFAIDKRDRVLVSEAFGGAANASATSSYNLEDGQLSVVSASMPTKQTAACWVVISKNGKFVYTTNTGSATVSGYRLSHDGSLSLLTPNGISATTGAKPTDADFSDNGKFLYTLNSGAHSITVLRLDENGTLWPVQELTGVPATAVGLVAR